MNQVQSESMCHFLRLLKSYLLKPHLLLSVHFRLKLDAFLQINVFK